MKRIEELMSALKEVKQELEKSLKVAPEGSKNRETYVDSFEKMGSAPATPPPPSPSTQRPTIGQTATSGGTTINSKIGNPFGKKEHMKIEKNGQWALNKLEDEDLPEEKEHKPTKGEIAEFHKPAAVGSRSGVSLIPATSTENHEYEEETHDKDKTAKLLRPIHEGSKNFSPSEIKSRKPGIVPIPAASTDDSNKPDISSDKTKTIGKAEDKPNKGHSSFTMEHVHHVSGMSDLGQARKYAHSVVDSSTANAGNKARMKTMIDRSKNPRHLAQGMSNHILAHPGEGLKVVK